MLKLSNKILLPIAFSIILSGCATNNSSNSYKQPTNYSSNSYKQPTNYSNNSLTSSDYYGNTSNSYGNSSGYSSNSLITTEPSTENSYSDYNHNYSNSGYSNYNNNYSKTNNYSEKSGKTIGDFTLTNVKWDKSRTSANTYSYGTLYTHVIDLDFENTSSSTRTFDQEDFYIKGPDGKYDSFASNEFKNIRPGEKKATSIVINFSLYDNLTGCELYYKDTYVCTF